MPITSGRTPAMVPQRQPVPKRRGVATHVYTHVYAHVYTHIYTFRQAQEHQPVPKRWGSATCNHMYKRHARQTWR